LTEQINDAKHVSAYKFGCFDILIAGETDKVLLTYSYEATINGINKIVKPSFVKYSCPAKGSYIKVELFSDSDCSGTANFLGVDYKISTCKKDKDGRCGYAISTCYDGVRYDDVRPETAESSSLANATVLDAASTTMVSSVVLVLAVVASVAVAVM